MVISLKVKTLDSQTYDFTVDDEISVKQFKETIAEKTNISADLQRIIYCGRVLSDEKLLKEYDVNGKVVHVVERPPPSSRISTNSNESTSGRRARFDGLEGNVRGSPLFRALDGMVVGAMTIPVNAPGATQPTVPPLTPSSSFCMNRITVARHMLDCANNIASYLENPERGLNNSSLDILAQGRWTMESTVVEVGISAADNAELAQNHTQHIVEALHGAVSAALRQNGHPNVTVVQLPTVFGSNGTAVVSTQNVNSMDDLESSRDPDRITDTTIMVTSEAPSDQSEQSVDETMNESSSAEADFEPENATGGSETITTDNNTSQEQRRPAGASASASNSPTRQRTGTRVLADVINQMTTVQNRLAPFVNRYYEILQNDPVFEENDTAGRESSQRIFDRVSEALHYMSHAQHAISDLMLDLSQPTPRYLCCRPILVEQSGFVSANNIASLFQPNGNSNGPSGNNGNPVAATIVQQSDVPSMPVFLRPSAPPPSQQQQQSQSQPQTQSHSIIIANPVANNQVSSGGSGGAIVMQHQDQNQNQQNINRNVHRVLSPLLVSMSPRLPSGNNNTTNSSSANTTNNTTASANDNGNQSADQINLNAANNPDPQPIAEIVMNIPESRVLNSNPQAHVARLIQAVVNSAPLDADLHVQINAPNLLTIGVPVPPMFNQQLQQQQSVSSASTLQQQQPIQQQQRQQQQQQQQQQRQYQQQQTNVTNVLSTGGGATNDMNNTTTSNDTNQARVTTATHPTTSTQTRSTPRPQVHIANIPPSQMWNTRVIPANMVSSFDRFLPCSSHHIRENESNTRSSPNFDSQPRRHIRRQQQQHQEHAHQQQQQQQPQQSQQQSQHSHNRQNQQVSRETSTASSTPLSTSNTQPISSNRTSSSSDDFYLSSSATETPANLFDELFVRLIRLMSNPNTFNSRIRSDLLEFIVNNLFAGAPINEENMNNAINNAIQLLNDALSHFDSADYDSRASVENFIRNSLPFIINLIREDDSDEFSTRLLPELINFIRRLLVIIVTCVGRTNAESYLNQLAVMALNSSQIRDQEFLRTVQRHLMHNIFRELDTTLQNTIDVQEFLVTRSSPEQQSSQNEPMETDEHMTDESNNIRVINERAIDVPSENSSMSEEQESIANTKSTTTTTAATPKPTSTTAINEPLPKVIIGSEPWHNHFPSNWLPIITRDIEKQRRQSPQSPFSDAYISGMSAKRRKLIANSKPPTDIQTLITDDVRRAIQAVGAGSNSSSSSNNSSSSGSNGSSSSRSTKNAAGAADTTVTPLTSEYTIEEISTAIGTDPAVQLSYREALRTSIQERLRTDPDFIPEKYPNSSKYFMK